MVYPTRKCCSAIVAIIACFNQLQYITSSLKERKLKLKQQQQNFHVWFCFPKYLLSTNILEKNFISKFMHSSCGKAIKLFRNLINFNNSNIEHQIIVVKFEKATCNMINIYMQTMHAAYYKKKNNKIKNNKNKRIKFHFQE